MVSEPFVAFLRRITPPEHVEAVLADRAEILGSWMKAVEQITAIRDAAIEHGVNDQVGEAIAHAELVVGLRRV